MDATKTPGLIFLDIDGTLIEHFGNHHEQIARRPSILRGVHKRLEEWDRAGWRIILTTGRRESTRRHTEEQLASLGVFYDAMIMGCGNGPRVLVNDQKPDGRLTAFAFCPKRNEGIENVHLT